MPTESSRTNGSANRVHISYCICSSTCFGRDDEDALAAAAADQLGEDHADLERLAEADRVGEQDARAQVLRVERLAHGRLLVGERVGEHAAC